jgi:exopolyphosphatase / guanosine-5'-triphosphate,3'-diphosphate pyrophosphatase
LKLASIDIGTNTCNLLIANVDENNNFEILQREKRPIKLIDSNYINNDISLSAIERCVNVINEYKSIAKEHNIINVITITTSAIRDAANSSEVISIISQKTGINVEIISGSQEAKLVYLGVNKAVKFSDESSLVIDIGGGSIEFIICNKSEIFWINSYPIGIARLLNRFAFSDPLTKNDIYFLNGFFEANLDEVLIKCKQHEVSRIIGSSGSFDTFKNLAICADPAYIPKNNKQSYLIDIESFKNIYQQLITLNIFQRIEMKGMDPIRVEMIPIAAVLMNFLINKLEINIFIQSAYSLKEGVIFNHLENK